MSVREALGGVTAYNHAKAGGYTGTYAEFCALMADYATVGESAAASAASAATDALKSEGNAIGKQNGTDVGSGSPYYHNNAKYYAEQAADAKDSATNSANSAGSLSQRSEAYAIGKRGGVDVGSSDEAYHNNSKYYSEQSSGYATTASGYATAADGSAEDSEAYAIGKRDGVAVGSSDPAYHNNSKYYSEQAAASATAAAASATSAQAHSQMIYIGADGKCYVDIES